MVRHPCTDQWTDYRQLDKEYPHAVIEGDQRMLRAALIVVPLAFALLFGVDWGTSSLVHPCLNQIVQSTSEQEPKNGSDKNNCPYQGGVIAEGFAFAASWHPEVWTALGTVVIAIFTTILGLFTISLARGRQSLQKALT